MPPNALSNVIHIVRGLIVVAIIAAYALLVHHTNTLIQANAAQFSLGGFDIVSTRVLAAILALAPLFLIVMTYTVNAKSRLAGVSVLMVFCAVVWLLWSFIQLHTSWIFWLLDIGLMLLLLLTFARTLFDDRKPLCVHFAEMINGGALPADHEIYARDVTIAWVIFFALIILISSLLFFLTPLSTWSFFINFLTLPLIALMFVGEYIARKCLLTNLPEGNVMDAVRAYMQHAAAEKSASKSGHSSK